MFRSGNASRKTTSGFTLIELLVVIAIIAILAAILFPVFAQAREKARQTACLSNFKQIGNALMMYTQDYDETMPFQDVGSGGYIIAFYNEPRTYAAVTTSGATKNIISWMWAIQSYLKNTQVYQCPNAVDNTGSAAPTALSRASYYGNGVVLGRAISDLPNPASLIWSQEGVDITKNSVTRPSACPSTSCSATSGYQSWLASSYSNIHSGGGNLLYCDGHAKWSKQSGIGASAYGLDSKDASGNDRMGYVKGISDGTNAALGTPSLF
jgi:prepilin-type N-terminal cleavage/methylation domain-containing protein/prepilin-type processing-associated H-X9-DG protein